MNLNTHPEVPQINLTLNLFYHRCVFLLLYNICGVFLNCTFYGHFAAGKDRLQACIMVEHGGTWQNYGGTVEHHGGILDNLS